MTFIYYCLQICGHRKRLLIKYEVDTIAASRHFAICTLIGKLVGSISSRISEPEKIGWDLLGIYAKLVGMTRRMLLKNGISPFSAKPWRRRGDLEGHRSKLPTPVFAYTLLY